MLRTGWKPAAPDFWTVDSDTTVRLNDQPFTKFQIIARALIDLQLNNWKLAARHAHDSGLETGIPDFGPCRRAIKYLNSHGLHVAVKGLELSMAGALFDPGPEDARPHTKYVRCGKAQATRFH